jgi:hypothetical protein
MNNKILISIAENKNQDIIFLKNLNNEISNIDNYNHYHRIYFRM